MSKELNLRELREKLTPEDISRILGKFDVKCYMETPNALIFPTCCHNLNGGSNKLYYYKNTYLFKCYTQCEGVFDIFELLLKMWDLRGVKSNIYNAVKFCGLNTDAISETNHTSTTGAYEYLYNLLHTKNEIIDLPTLDKSILNRFVFDKTALSIWANENISYETMQKYDIKFDPIANCITIPNYDIDGNLISVRGRFLGEDADAKYKPIVYDKKVLSHPSTMALYGLNINKDSISRKGKVIIFEGEKSVLKADTIYGNNNFSVATLGKNISMQQIRLLLKLGVREVVIAYDRDYVDYNSMDMRRKEYETIAKRLKSYFNVCYLMDLDCNLVGYKDSPIDKGQEVFEKLIANRIYV